MALFGSSADGAVAGVPPVPLRPLPLAANPGALTILRLARRDLLSFWHEGAYRSEFFAKKMLRRWIFIANSPDTVEHVFVTRSELYERKSPYLRKALDPLLGDGLFASDGATWKRRRALQAPAFSAAHLRGFGATMAQCARELRERWRARRDTAPLAVLPEMAGLTAEIVGRTMFEAALGAERAARLVHGFSDYQAAIEQFDLGAFFGLPGWFPRTPQWRRARKAAAAVHEVVEEVLARCERQPPAPSRLAGLLLRAQAPRAASGLTPEQVRNEAVVIFMAGHETTANALAWAWYLLALHPQAEARLHEELARVLGGRDPGYDDVAALRFTRAVIEEALRLYPPVPILSRECVGEDTIRGRTVPKGSIMLVVPWLLHRHELLWERPHEFVPERFLPDWPKRHAKFAYIPFSTGPRVCLGAAFGLTEAVLCLATLAQAFALRIPEGHEVGYECRLTLRPAAGLPMRLLPRP
jgi:cytochrome P450